MVALGIGVVLFTVGVIVKYNLLRFIPLQRGECYLTKQEQGELRHILRHLVTIFDDMNVTYWLDYGTLIGALRYGDIMSYDTDGDIAFLMNEFYKQQKVNERLRRFDISYSMGTSYFGRARYGTMWVDVTRWRVHSEKSDGMEGELLVKDLTSQDEKNRDFYSRHKDESEEFPLLWMQPRRTVKFLNGTAKIPNEAEKLIRHRYPYSYRFNVPYKFKCWI